MFTQGAGAKRHSHAKQAPDKREMRFYVAITRLAPDCQPDRATVRGTDRASPRQNSGVLSRTLLYSRTSKTPCSPVQVVN
jgi:hypothetical protein